MGIIKLIFNLIIDNEIGVTLNKLDSNFEQLLLSFSNSIEKLAGASAA